MCPLGQLRASRESPYIQAMIFSWKKQRQPKQYSITVFFFLIVFFFWSIYVQSALPQRLELFGSAITYICNVQDVSAELNLGTSPEGVQSAFQAGLDLGIRARAYSSHQNLPYKYIVDIAYVCDSAI